MALLLTFIAAGYSVLAVWAATSQRHWFLRAAVFCGALALLLPIDAYEPLVLFGLVGVFSATGASVLRRFSSQSKAEQSTDSRWRFGTRDLLFAMAIVACASLVVSLILREGIELQWAKAVAAAALLVLIAALAVGFVRGPWPRRSFVGLLMAIPFAAAADAAFLGDWMAAEELLEFYRDMKKFPAVWGYLTLIYTCFAFWSLLLAGFVAAWSSTGRASTRSLTKRLATTVTVTPITLVAAWIYWRMLIGPAASTPDLLEGENVYPRILAIAEGVETSSPQHAAEVYAKVLPLLTCPGHAVLDWRGATRRPIERMQAKDQRHYYGLARSLNAEGGRLHSVGKQEQAAEFCEASLRLSAMARRHGIAADSMASDSNRGALTSLAKVRRDLAPATARRVARLLEALEEERDSVDEVLARDARYRFLTERWRYRFMHVMFVDLMKMKRVRDPQDWIVDDWAIEFSGLARLVSLDLALRAFHKDHGSWPKGLTELVPEYLESIPTDPLSGMEYVYRAAEPEFVLYSVGRDGRDDQGRFSNMIQFAQQLKRNIGFDIDVETLTRP